MRKYVLALLAVLLLLLGVGAGTAAASGPTQAVGQDASSQQSASSDANATQVAPSNSNVDVRIFSPGDGGDVKQTNAAGALAVAGNANSTDQSATQTQSGAGTQAVGQEAKNDQAADATANAVQVKPSNENISVRIKSPGDDGDVTQTNAARAGAAAGNANETTQSAEQAQGGGCKCGGGGKQEVGQEAKSKQDANADATAKQEKPSNSNVSVRIGSPGDNGDVEQTNAALAGAKAGNVNETSQSANQDQSGDGCKCHGDGVQAIGQDAKNDQSASSEANAVQHKPSNENTSVRIHSPGDDGDVTQTNLARAVGFAGNANATDQSATQSQRGGDGCKCYGTSVQAVGQFAHNKQDADADATAKQIKPSNSNTPVRIGSRGDGGSVTQTNAALAGAKAGNLNLTDQSATQSQAGGGGVQAIGQDAGSKQYAGADGTAFQLKPSNSNTPVWIGGGHGQRKSCGCEDRKYGHGKSCGCEDGRYGGHGHGKCGCDDDNYGDNKSDGYGRDRSGSGGDVFQTNVAKGFGVAGNANLTEQAATQSQGGGDYCRCGGRGVQAIGQSAWNEQDADADANAAQLFPSNDNGPVRIGSPGSGGSVRQTNAALALALAKNVNALSQEATQTQ
jgi:hypothetical protein